MDKYMGIQETICAIYYRYKVIYLNRFNSFERAKRFLDSLSDAGDILPIAIFDEEKQRVLWHQEDFEFAEIQQEIAKALKCEKNT